MAAKKKSTGRAPTKAKPATSPQVSSGRGPVKKATKKLARPSEMLESFKRAKKAVKKAVRVAKRKIVDTEKLIEERVRTAVGRKKKKPGGPSVV